MYSLAFREPHQTIRTTINRFSSFDKSATGCAQSFESVHFAGLANYPCPCQRHNTRDWDQRMRWCLSLSAIGIGLTGRWVSLQSFEARVLFRLKLMRRTNHRRGFRPLSDVSRAPHVIGAEGARPLATGASPHCYGKRHRHCFWLVLIESLDLQTTDPPGRHQLTGLLSCKHGAVAIDCTSTRCFIKWIHAALDQIRTG